MILIIYFQQYKFELTNCVSVRINEQASDVVSNITYIIHTHKIINQPRLLLWLNINGSKINFIWKECGSSSGSPYSIPDKWPFIRVSYTWRQIQCVSSNLHYIKSILHHKIEILQLSININIKHRHNFFSNHTWRCNNGK